MKLSKWIPIQKCPQRMYLNALRDDFEGFRLLLVGDEADKRTLRISFDSHLAYRNVDESERLKMLLENTELTGKWTFFTTTDSDFLNWLIDQSLQIVSKDQLVHYIIGTPNDIVEVLAMKPPIVEWLNN